VGVAQTHGVGFKTVALPAVGIATTGLESVATGAASADAGLRKAIDRLRYSLKDNGHGTYRGTNPAQGLTVEFNKQEVRLSHPNGSVTFQLTGYGHGELRKPAAATLVGTSGRLEYRRGDITEWYENRPEGLEQGFTLAHRPGPSDNERLVIAFHVAGGLTTLEKPDQGSVLFGSALRYSGLKAVDARGRVMKSRMELRGSEIRLVIEDREAQYPLLVDPIWTQVQELTASDGFGFGQFVSVNGDTALIGDPGKAKGQGAAYVFVAAAGGWTLQQELTASDGGAGDEFGWGVSVSGDTALIGAYGRSGSQGAAYVFVRKGGVWSQQQELTSSDGVAQDNFGFSVSLCGDTAVVGAWRKNGDQGAAYVFAGSGGVWTQQQELTASDGVPNDSFGSSVSVSGGTALIGAYNKNNNQGTAYVFGSSGGVWSQQQELNASDGMANDCFGFSVSLSWDTALIGASYKSINQNSYQGTAYLFVRNGGVWTEQKELIASDGAARDFFGYSVSLCGNTALIGIIGGNRPQGAAYVFVGSGGTWTLQQELTASDGAANDSFGASVAVNRGAALVGAYTRNSGAGTAYVFMAPTLATDSLLVGGAGGTSSVLLSSVASWTATANDSFLQISPGSTTGTGSAVVAFTYAAFTGTGTRMGTLTVAGLTLSVTQVGSAYMGPGGLNTLVSSGLGTPEGLAVDRSGNVYVADVRNNTIEEWSVSTQQLTTLVSVGLSNPSGVAVDGAGNVYIADTGDNAVKEWNAVTHQLTTLVSSGLNAPNGVAVDTAGDVYIADTGNNTIKEWKPSTQLVATLVSSGLNAPNGVAVDIAGDVYFSDTSNNAIKEWVASNQQVTTLVSTGLNQPVGVAVDGSGNVYFGDYGNYAIKEWSASTQKVVTLVSTGPNVSVGVAVDVSGNLYISQPVNAVVGEVPNAFVGPANLTEPASGGSDALLPVVPATTSFAGIFAPSSDQSWLTIGTVSKGVIAFSFAANPAFSARTAHIAALGQQISITQLGAPFLTVTKAHEGNFVQGQNGATYTVRVSNSSAGIPTVGVVTVTETVPVGLTLVSMAGSEWTCPVGGTSCSRSDSLAVGASYPTITVMVNVATNAPPSVNNEVSVSGGGSAPASASDLTTIPQPVLSITKGHTGNFTQGQTGATYTVLVSNSAAAEPTAGVVTVTETVPAGLTLVSMAGSGWTCPVGGTSCSRSDSLAVGASYPTITVTVNVATNAPPSVNNEVSVSGGGSAPASASDLTMIPPPALSITKSHTGNFTQGQTGATYTVLVSNSAAAEPTAGVVTVTENVPVGLTLVSMAGSGWTCQVGGTSCSRSDALAVGASYPTITVMVNVATNAPPSVNNEVSASGGGSAAASASDLALVNPGPQYFLYVATEGSGVSAYTIKPITGALTPVPGSPFPAGSYPYSVTIDPTGRFVYVANYQSDNNISAYTINPATGALTAVPGSPFPLGPSLRSVTVDPTGKFAYAAEGSGVAAFTINSATGALTAVSGSPFSAGTFPSSIAVDPTGRFAYVASNNVSAYMIDPATGALTPVPGSPFAAGTAPLSVTVDPTGQFAYVVNSNSSGNISAYAINPATGALTAVAGSPFPAGTYARAITVDPTGRFAYVANVVSANVSAYTINPATGALSAIPDSPFGAGSYPYSVTVGPTGQFAYVANYQSNNVSAYAINPATGALSAIPDSPFGAGSLPVSVATTSVNEPMLSIAKSHTGNLTQGQSGATYTVTVSNLSVEIPTIGMVTVTENVPVGLALVSMAGNGWNCPSGATICTRTDALAGGASYPPITVTVNVANNLSASVTNEVFLSGGGSATTKACDQTTIVQLPALTVSITQSGSFAQGQTGATYLVTVTNGGDVPTSGTVTVTDTLPAGLTATAVGGTGWSCTLATLTCTRSDELAAGGTYQMLAVTVNVAGNAPASVINRASVSGGGSATANASDPTTIINDPLTITTSSVPVANQYQPYSTTLAAIGGTPPYTWSVVSSTGVSLPEGMSLDPASAIVSATQVNGQGGYAVTVQAADSSTPDPITATATVNFGVNSDSTYGGCQMFPRDSIYNQRTDSLPVDTDPSHQIPTASLTSPLHPDFGGGFYPGPGGLPFMRVPANQQVSNVTLAGGDQIDPSGAYQWPFPSWPNAVIEGTAYGLNGDDHHLLILQSSVNNVSGPQTGACTLYETYSTAAVPGMFDAGSNTWSLGLASTYFLNSDEIAASEDALDQGGQDSDGIPIVPLLVKYSEVPLGVQHPLRIDMSSPTNGFVWPATGCCSGSGPPQGLLYRLKASVNWQATCPVNTNPQAATVLQALQQYGAYMSNHNTPGFIEGVPDVRWNDSDLACLGHFPLSDLEVVDNSALEVSDISGQTQPYVAPAALATGTVDTAYSAALVEVGGNPATMQWSVSSGALPPGLVLNASTGTISGTPSSFVGSPYNFGVTATDTASGYASHVQTLSIGVVGPSLLSIAVTPAISSIAKGLSQEFTAMGTYSDDSTQNISGRVAWNSATTTVGTIGSPGLAIGVGVGTSIITASQGGITSPSVILTVTAPTLVSLAVTPATPSIVVLTPQQFQATGTYTDGTTLNLSGQVTWSSQTISIASINGSGKASAVAVGASNITATLGLVSGVASLTVLPLGPCSLNLAGTSTVADAQAIISQALGTAQAINDLDGDHVVNLVDIQRLISAILNLGCAE
jgi:uncharacterized repeat protein (TIGR01451 family)